ncbi:RDD family protein [Vagococcus sp. BWB3-3]|uniref:RDD family protein n=1 Tax=Vagococcus allomyrinae TaxID=2794353 RepID=A0A940PFT7_9ENTE|nr:RDD family protein [Vagococcus allomyrinae]
MAWSKFILRTFSFLIDLVIVYLPILLICVLLLDIPFKLSEIYGQVILIAYSVLASDIFNGRTLGKKLARMITVYQDGVKAPLVKKGMREVTKLLYFLPYAGPIFVMISLCLLKVTGKALHDYLGESEVILENAALEGELR